MKLNRVLALGLTGPVLFVFLSTTVLGQIVINELVKEVRDGTNDGAAVANETREFVELYNAGGTTVDLTNWSIGTFDLGAGNPGLSYTITSGTIAPGGYFVIGDAGVSAGVFTPAGAPGEMFPDSVANVLELRNGPDPFSGSVVDAVAYDVYRTGLTRLTLATAEQLAQIGSGFQGEHFSLDEASPNISVSWSRYRDGLDTNKNGHDFGLLPMTPGASNNLTEVASHTVPDVDGLTLGDNLSQYHASFVLPRVINPLAADANNPRALPTASPQGGLAIVSWDPAFGGNSSYGKELVNGFDLYAYFDTDPMGVGPITLDEEWETSIYGIGSTDPFFRNPDPSGGISQIPAGGAEPVTRNSSTGVGWMFQRFEDGSGTLPGFTKLMLVDFGDGGDSELAGEWDILHTIDMTTVDPDWYELGISYDPDTNQVTGSFDGEEFTFTLDYDLLGTFFVGYREGISGTATHLLKHDPPTFDMIATAPPILAGDYNDDGNVDAADYVLWRKGGTLANDDTPGNQPGDYGVWVQNFGEPAAGSGGGAVPEPGTIVLGMLALIGLAVTGRSRS